MSVVYVLIRLCCLLIRHISSLLSSFLLIVVTPRSLFFPLRTSKMRDSLVTVSHINIC